MLKRLLDVGIRPYFYQKRAKNLILDELNEFSSKYFVEVVTSLYVKGNNLIIDAYVQDSDGEKPFSKISFHLSKHSGFIVPIIKGSDVENSLTNSLENIANSIPNLSLNSSSAFSDYSFNSEYEALKNVSLTPKPPIYFERY